MQGTGCGRVWLIPLAQFGFAHSWLAPTLHPQCCDTNPGRAGGSGTAGDTAGKGSQGRLRANLPPPAPDPTLNPQEGFSHVISTSKQSRPNTSPTHGTAGLGLEQVSVVLGGLKSSPSTSKDNASPAVMSRPPEQVPPGYNPAKICLLGTNRPETAAKMTQQVQ